VLHGKVLMDFVDATMTGDAEKVNDIRAQLVSLIGEAGVVDAAAVMAMFQLNTRAADAVGIVVEDRTVSGRNKVAALFGFDVRPEGIAP
jgi:hypothetical protein